LTYIQSNPCYPIRNHACHRYHTPRCYLCYPAIHFRYYYLQHSIAALIFIEFIPSMLLSIIQFLPIDLLKIIENRGAEESSFLGFLDHALIFLLAFANSFVFVVIKAIS